MPLLPPKGPYAVSTLTIEVPGGKYAKNLIRSPFHYKNDSAKIDPFQFQTTLVTLFYPTLLEGKEKSEKTTFSSSATGKPISWLNEPRLKSIEGLLKYGNLSRYLAYPAVFILPFQTKLPYGSDGPLATESPSLLNPDQNSESSTDTVPPSAKPNTNLFPVGVFSHGMAGTRTTYSSYLSELASQGMIIASVEHRDGSATYTQIRKKEGEKVVESDRLYTKFDELDFEEKENGEKTTIWDMRKSQLNLRKVEMLEALDVLHQLNQGKGDQLAQVSTRSIDNKQAELSQWKSRLDMDNIWALGHSYGGATSIEILRDQSAPFTHAIVLDPWLEAIAKVGEGAAPLKRPLYVINSEGFTIWRKHFAWLRDLVNESNEQTGRGWLMSIVKTKHTDFSDFPFLMPRFFKPASGVEAPQAAETLSVFSKASRLQFINRFDRSDLGMPVRDERAGEVEAKDLGQGGFVVWHPLEGAPSASL